MGLTAFRFDSRPPGLFVFRAEVAETMLTIMQDAEKPLASDREMAGRTVRVVTA